MESLDTGKQQERGWLMRRVIVNIMIIVFIIGGCYASYEIGRFRELVRGAYRWMQLKTANANDDK